MGPWPAFFRYGPFQLATFWVPHESAQPLSPGRIAAHVQAVLVQRGAEQFDLSTGRRLLRLTDTP